MPRPLRERRSPLKADVRRDELLDRLVEVIVEHGFAEASIEELARALRCSKSTLYVIADSKEQIIAAAVRRFFRRAAAHVDDELQRSAGEPVAQRIRTYLTAIAADLAPATPAFFADIDSLASTREIYRQNTRVAAERVQALVREASPEGPSTQATFVGAVAAQVMEGIHRGEIETATGLDDSAAFRALADLIVRGLGPTPVEGDT
ncbi:TetR/AcrR family transcriptional regulator [Microbacterium sp. BWT-B31]|uniref:TetR/AcrR family transcriptional regulator n=1 Tax=Microbacterium sp. BWT-B31 TaxID=3232072 RepID=UPI003526D5AF